MTSQQYQKHRRTGPRSCLREKNVISTKNIIENALENTFETLSAEDYLMLKLRFESRKSVSEISRLFNESRKITERKLKNLLHNLRKDISELGLLEEDIQKVFKTSEG